MQNLHEALNILKERLERREFDSEQKLVRRGVIPVLQGLGWRAGITLELEYRLKGGNRADVALLVDGVPSVFVEVKKPDMLDRAAVAQSIEYSMEHDHPFGVLTDGESWRFYMTGLGRSHEERCAASIAITEQPITKIAAQLQALLGCDNVAQGSAAERISSRMRIIEPFRKAFGFTPDDGAIAYIEHQGRRSFDEFDEPLVDQTDKGSDTIDRSEHVAADRSIPDYLVLRPADLMRESFSKNLLNLSPREVYSRAEICRRCLELAADMGGNIELNRIQQVFKYLMNKEQLPLTSAKAHGYYEYTP